LDDFPSPGPAWWNPDVFLDSRGPIVYLLRQWMGNLLRSVFKQVRSCFLWLVMRYHDVVHLVFRWDQDVLEGLENIFFHKDLDWFNPNVLMFFRQEIH
jgi:hypothetical protein